MALISTTMTQAGIALVVCAVLTKLADATTCHQDKCVGSDCSVHNRQLQCSEEDRETILCECCPRCKKKEDEECGGDFVSFGKCRQGLKCVDLVSEDGDKLYKGQCKPLSFSAKNIIGQQKQEAFNKELCFDKPYIKNPCIQLSCVDGNWHESIEICPVKPEQCINNDEYHVPPHGCCGTCLPRSRLTTTDLREPIYSIDDKLRRNHTRHPLNPTLGINPNNRNRGKHVDNGRVRQRPNYDVDDGGQRRKDDSDAATSETNNGSKQLNVVISTDDTFIKVLIVIGITGFLMTCILMPFAVCLYRRQKRVYHQTYNFAIPRGGAGSYGQTPSQASNLCALQMPSSPRISKSAVANAYLAQQQLMGSSHKSSLLKNDSSRSRLESSSNPPKYPGTSNYTTSTVSYQDIATHANRADREYNPTSTQDSAPLTTVTASNGSSDGRHHKVSTQSRRSNHTIQSRDAKPKYSSASMRDALLHQLAERQDAQSELSSAVTAPTYRAPV